MNLKSAVIKLSKIKENPFNPKRDFKDYELKGFDLSLKKWGVIRQLIVCNSPFTADEFIVIDGNSLFKKLKELKKETTECLLITKHIESEQDLKRLTLDYNLALKNIDTQALSILFKDVKEQEQLEKDYSDIFDIGAEIENIGNIEKNIDIYPKTEFITFKDEAAHIKFKRYIQSIKKISETSKLMKLLASIKDEEVVENLPLLLNSIRDKRRGVNE